MGRCDSNAFKKQFENPNCIHKCLNTFILGPFTIKHELIIYFGYTK